MKKIFRIARIEVNLLFYSPIAWMVMAIFLVLTGITFLEKLTEYVSYKEMGRGSLVFMHNLTNAIFNSGRVSGPYLSHLAEVGYWLIPIITMGLLSRETSSGTINLLYSSPIKVREIIAGKFLSMLIFNFLLVIIIIITMVGGIFFIESADIGLLISGLLGMYLLLATYSAIGLYMSSLTNYQVVAAMTTFAVLTLINYIGGIWQNIAFVRDLTYFLSINGRASNFFNGLLSSTDIIYFLIIIGLFLFLTYLKLEEKRATANRFYSLARYVGLFTVVLTIGYLSSLPRFTAYWDVTANNLNTISSGMRTLMQQLGNKPVEINSYINLLDGSTLELGLPEKRKGDEQRWSKYTRFKPDIKFTYTYFFDSIPDPEFYRNYPKMTLRQIAEQVAESYGLDMNKVKSPDQIHKIVSMPLEKGRYCMQVKYENKSTFLRITDSDGYRYPIEPEIAAAFKRLLAAKMPKFAFLKGEYERSPFLPGDKNYIDMTLVNLRFTFVNQGFDIDSLDLHYQEIPTDVTGLVIADPKKSFDPIVQPKLQRYIDQGGNLMIFGEPGRQAIINPFIAQFGIKLNDGILIQKSDDYAPDLLTSFLTDNAINIQKNLSAMVIDSLPILQSGATGLSFSPISKYKTEPVAATDRRLAWQKNSLAVLDSAEIKFSSQSGDQKGTFITMVKATRSVGNKEQHIFISSDADWLASKTTRIWIDKSNAEFSAGVFGWFTGGDFPVDLSRPVEKDRILHLNSRSLPYISALLTIFLPSVLVVIGSVILIRRKQN